MNEVFIIGKIISKINFKFVINNKNKFSKLTFIIQTLDEQEIMVVGYNSIADFTLKHLKKKDRIFVNGSLNTNMEIEIKEFDKIKDKAKN